MGSSKENPSDTIVSVILECEENWDMVSILLRRKKVDLESRVIITHKFLYDTKTSRTSTVAIL